MLILLLLFLQCAWRLSRQAEKLFSCEIGEAVEFGQVDRVVELVEVGIVAIISSVHLESLSTSMFFGALGAFLDKWNAI